MKLDDIHTQWEADSKIDRVALEDESLKIPQLHHKYWKIFCVERSTLKQLENDHKCLYKDKHEYFQGILDEDTLVAHAWKPWALKVLRSDLPMYIDSDKDIQTLRGKIDLQQTKLELLESIIKTLATRGYQIKSAIEFIKFKMGA
jgi:hypothetical protein